VIQKLATEVFEVTGKNKKLEIALELERIALEDEYFVKRKLYPNVDFYSGLIYEAMGFPLDFFPVLFAIRARQGGSLIGRSTSSTPSRRLPGHGSSTSANEDGPGFPSTSGKTKSC